MAPEPRKARLLAVVPGIPLVEGDDTTNLRTGGEESCVRHNPYLQLTLDAPNEFHATTSSLRLVRMLRRLAPEMGALDRLRYLTLLVRDRQQRLELRSFRLFVHHRGFNVRETCVAKHGLKFFLAEA